MVALVGLVVTFCIPYGLLASRLFWIGMWAVSSVLYIIVSDALLDTLAEMQSYNVGNELPHTRATLAGAIMTAAGNVFLLLALGTDWPSHEYDDDERACSRKNRATATPPPATAV